MTATVAQYDSVCEWCGEMIRAHKDQIVHLDEDDCWVHARCVEDEGYNEEDD